MSSISPIITEIEQAQVKKLPAFRPGDTVRVHFKILEGDKTRVQAFEGQPCITDFGLPAGV